MKVVTSGPTYIDIDAYGGCIAYAELLNLQGEAAVAASGAVWNESITPTIRSWPTELKTAYTADPTDEFVLIDVSDPEHFDTFVDLDRIAEIIDHHPEFADYWPERLGKGSDIEFIGAACTMVYERWVRAGRLAEISATSARLLMCGILDNTLNFQAVITTERDKTAYAELAKYADLPDNWPQQYFEECQQAVTNDLATALQNDTKNIYFSSLGRKVRTGQLVVWQAGDVLSNGLETIRSLCNQERAEWFVNIVSIGEGKNYVVANGADVRSFVQRVLDVTFQEDVATTDRLWLRKEIVKQDMQQNAQQG